MRLQLRLVPPGERTAHRAVFHFLLPLAGASAPPAGSACARSPGSPARCSTPRPPGSIRARARRSSGSARPRRRAERQDTRASDPVAAEIGQLPLRDQQQRPPPLHGAHEGRRCAHADHVPQAPAHGRGVQGRAAPQQSQRAHGEGRARLNGRTRGPDRDSLPATMCAGAQPRRVTGRGPQRCRSRGARRPVIAPSWRRPPPADCGHCSAAPRASSDSSIIRACKTRRDVR